MNKEESELLITAMMLLEIYPDTPDEYKEGSMWAVHECVQRAWGLISRHENPHRISDNTQILLSTMHAQSAIANAKGGA